MTMPIKRKTKTLPWQYFLSYFTVMILVMAILLTYTYATFYSFHKRILIGQYEGKLEVFQNHVDDQLRQMVAVASQMTASPDVSPFDFREEPDRAARVIRLLRVYKASATDVYGLFLRFYGAEYVLGSNSSYTTKNFIHSAARFSDISPEEVLNLMENTKRVTVLPVQAIEGYSLNNFDSKNHVVPIFVPLLYEKGARCGTVLYLVEQRTYIDWMDSMLGPRADVFMLKDGQPLVSRSVSGVPLESIPQDTDSMKHNGRRYQILRSDVSSYGFDYCVLIPESELSMAMSGSVQLLLLVAAGVAALGLLIINRLVQRNVKPIQMLHSMLSDREPTGNELVEIRDSVQALIDQNTAMSQKMENTEVLRKSEFVRRFLINDFAGTDDFLTQAEEIHLNVDRACYMVGIIAKPADADYELTPEKINHLFATTVSGVCRSLGLHDKVLLLAFADSEETLLRFLEAKFSGIRACCTGVTMALSGVHGDFREGPRAYLEAENAFERRFLKGNAEAIRFTGTEVGDAQVARSTQQSVERLRAALHAGDAARVSESLREITEAMQSMKVSLFTFRCMYNDILNVVSKEARQSSLDEKQVYDLFQLSQCLSWDDLDRLLHQVCSKLIRQKGEPETPVVDGPVAKAREIISRRFSEPELSVSGIAQEVGMSDSRLSVAFKEAYHMTPLECITAHRMRRARRLLRETEMPVKDIALECGYYDIPAFNRRFKSYTGKTPQQYKTQVTTETSSEPEA